MSYTEYNNLFSRCQENAPYKMYAYDIVDSKKIKDRLMVKKLYDLIDLVGQKIHLIELKNEIKILYDETDLNNKNDELLKLEKSDLNKLEPILLGDAIAFTVYNKTIEDNIVDELFEEAKKELEIEYSFHKASGVYETNQWIEGNTRYFRGYCFLYLTNKHKNKTK